MLSKVGGRSLFVLSLLLLVGLVTVGCTSRRRDRGKAELTNSTESNATSANTTVTTSADHDDGIANDVDDSAESNIATEDNVDASDDSSTAAITEEEPEKPVDVVTLGDPALTAGIPGEGDLKNSEIEAWLAQPENHIPLKVNLPRGLAAGASGVKIPEDNPITRAKIELGRQLYFDRRLSSDATISCADCHHPDEGYARATQFGEGVGGQTGNRNSPTSYNRILSEAQFWDGRAASLEEQAIGPIANPIEMANTHDVAVQTVKDIEGYRLQFEKIFDDGINIENIGRAIATFERVIVTGPAPFDFYESLRSFERTYAQDLEDLEELKEEDPDLVADYMKVKNESDAHPMSESAKRGREIFFGEKGGCTACHVGANFTDELYHNLGVGMDADEPDLGRYVVTKEEKDKGAFKTPTIRNVALTAPYMHDGSQKTLQEVVEWYDKGGHPNPHLSDKIRKLNLTDQEKADLVAFMEACTGEFPPVEDGRLPN